MEAVEQVRRPGRASTPRSRASSPSTETSAEVSERDLQNGELRLGLPAALIVLVIVFGALVAASLPLLLAIVSIAVALGLTALVAAQWELSLFVTNMLTGMGLALGIDYALFVVSRFREERASGREKTDAIAAAGATANRAVLFSGSAFVLAMTGLLLVQSTIMRSLALGAILVGIVSVVAALTLLPAVLQLLGDRVNALRVPVLGRQIDRPPDESRFWGGIVAARDRAARRSEPRRGRGRPARARRARVRAEHRRRGNQHAARRPAVEAGLPRARSARSRRASAEPAADRHRRPDRPRRRSAARSRGCEERLADDPRFGRPSLQVNPAGDLAALSVPLVGDALSDRAVAAVRRAAQRARPGRVRRTPSATVLVTGTTAENIDYFDVMGRWLPIVFVFVLGLSFVLLTVAFRSVVIAGDGDRPQPALGRRGLRAARARLPGRRRRGPASASSRST